MNSDWRNYPLASFVSAIQTVWGRLIVYFLACGLGAAIGDLIAYADELSVLDTLIGIVILPFVNAVSFPFTLMASILFSYGLIATPLLALGIYFYVNLQFRAYFLFFPVLVALWVSYEMSLQQIERDRKKAEWVEKMLGG